MTVTLVVASIAIGVTVLAVFLLAARDARRHRRVEDQRPVAERIGSIREDAAFMTQYLQEFLQQRSIEHPEAAARITAVLGYYRRLEVLASSPNPSVKEVQLLANEAAEYIRKYRLKDFFVAQQCRSLARLAERQKQQEGL